MNPWRVQSPCKDCPNRFVGCHSSCAKYIDFQQKLEIKRKEMKNKKVEETGGGYTEYIVGVHNARKRRKFKGWAK